MKKPPGRKAEGLLHVTPYPARSGRYPAWVKRPDPLIVPWQGRQLRIRHDDPRLSPYSPRGATIRSAVELASDVDGLRLVLVSAIGDRYRVRVSDDDDVVGLWRR